MTLFEINEQIKQAIEACIDPETGEIMDFSALEELQIAKDEKVKNTALYYLNLMAEAQALAEQEKKFKERKQAVQNKAERIKNQLAFNLNGEAFNFTEVKVFFKPSEETVITDQEEFERYAKRHKELVKLEIKPDKKAIKQAIANGLKVKGAEIVQKQNIQIK